MPDGYPLALPLLEDPLEWAALAIAHGRGVGEQYGKFETASREAGDLPEAICEAGRVGSKVFIRAFFEQLANHEFVSAVPEKP